MNSFKVNTSEQHARMVAARIERIGLTATASGKCVRTDATRDIFNTVARETLRKLLK